MKKKKIVFIWEMGENSGHILRLLPLALELNNRGYEAIFILRNLEHVEQHFGSYDFEIYQAPIWISPSSNREIILSYSGILKKLGYNDIDGLTGLIKAWKCLFKKIQPDLMIFDHSPTALLASNEVEIPRIIFTESFSCPSRSTPLPPMRWWEKTNLQNVAREEQKVLQIINGARERLDLLPLNSVADLFKVDRVFIACFKELDQYPARVKEIHTGPIISKSIGVEPVWPSVKGEKIFAYVSLQYKAFDSLIKTFATLDCSVLVYAPGFSSRQFKKYKAKNINFLKKAANIDRVRELCDLAVCHSGAGTGVTILLAGKPVLLLPMHNEQFSMALRIKNLGCGMFIWTKSNVADFKSAISSLLNNRKYTHSAKAFAKKHADYKSEKTMQSIVQQIEKFLE